MRILFLFYHFCIDANLHLSISLPPSTSTFICFSFSPSHSLYRRVCIFDRLNCDLVCGKGEMQVQQRRWQRRQHNNFLALLLVCLSVCSICFRCVVFSIAFICTKSKHGESQKLKQNFCDKIQFINFFSSLFILNWIGVWCACVYFWYSLCKSSAIILATKHMYRSNKRQSFVLSKL